MIRFLVNLRRFSKDLLYNNCSIDMQGFMINCPNLNFDDGVVEASCVCVRVKGYDEGVVIA